MLFIPSSAVGSKMMDTVSYALSEEVPSLIVITSLAFVFDNSVVNFTEKWPMTFSNNDELGKVGEKVYI